MRHLRDLGLIGLLFGVLIVFTIVGPGRQRPPSGAIRGSTHATSGEGALGLQLWLRSLHYRADQLEPADWQIPSGTDLLIMLSPTKIPLTTAESNQTLAWVAQGGILVSVVESKIPHASPNPLWSALGAAIVVSPTADLSIPQLAVPPQPLLTSPPVSSVEIPTSASITTATGSAGTTGTDAWVTLLASRFGPVVVGRQHGRGYVFLAASAEPFTNAGLQRPGSAAVILNLISRVPREAHIAFDEYHHGFHSASSVPAMFTGSWWGWPILYSLLVIGLYLPLAGRRFGRVVAAEALQSRRSTAEYINSLADLFRRAGKRGDIAQHYRVHLKRRLAQRYGFAMIDDDDEFVQNVARWAVLDNEKLAQLRTLLHNLDRKRLGERELIELARAATAWSNRG